MNQVIRIGLLMACGAALVGCAGTGGASKSGPPHLVMSDDGLSEIQVPARWQVRPDIGRNADLRVADSERNSYLLVTTYGEDQPEAQPLAQAAQRMANALRESAGSEKMSPARLLTLGGRPAVQHEIRTQSEDSSLVFLSTLVEGARARYHLIGWAPAKGDLDGLRAAMNGFRESETRRTARSRVNLEFKWPAPMTSRAAFRTKMVDRGQTTEIQGEVVSTVKALGKDELLVGSRFTSHKFDSTGAGKSKELDHMLQELLKTATSDVPDYVVNRDGEFVRVENLGAYHKRVQEALLKALPKGNAQARERAGQLVKTTLTEEMLTSSLREGWNSSVENWAGSSFVVGQPYTYTVAYQTPALDNRAFPMEITQQLTGYVPCHAGASAKSCVRLVQQSRLGGRDYTRAVSDAVSKQINGATVSAMEVINTVEVVTDPKSLRPYQTHEKKVKRITVKAEGQSKTVEDLDETSTTYSY